MSSISDLEDISALLSDLKSEIHDIILNIDQATENDDLFEMLGEIRDGLDYYYTQM